MYVSTNQPASSDMTMGNEGHSRGTSMTSSTADTVLNSNNLQNTYDADRGIFWSAMRPEDGRGCFTLPMLNEMAGIGEKLRFHGAMQEAADLPSASYFVSTSLIPGVYNLGGDLSLFADRIRCGDRDTVRLYARSCIDVVYENSIAFGQSMLTIGLIQGDALGGGLECALSYDLIVAERSAKIGLPEVLFDLFPGMGALSFLSRKIGRAAAEKLIFSGKTCSAEEMHSLGVVDILAEDGEGVHAVNAFVDKASKRHNAHMAIYKARRRVAQITKEELIDVVDIWTDAAMKLKPNNLRMMDRLGAAQKKRLSSSTAPLVAVA